MRTLHVGLRVADLDSSIAFYTSLGYEVLGQVPATELGTLAMLKLPGDEFVSLELVHDPDNGRVGPGGLSHLVIHVEDVHATVARVAARGIPTEEPASPDGSADSWTAWVTDPDGHRIEFVQWPRRAPRRHDHLRPGGSRAGPMTTSQPRSAKDVVAELFRRQKAGDDTVLDDLVAPDMINHAAGPQGREGLRTILRTIEVDLGPTGLEQHHLIGEGDLVVQHVTLHGTHRASTMPLLADVPVSGRPAVWTFIHIWRVVDGMLVEHWACRDDMGLVEQLRPS
ncbi:Glyoxalase/bleomycin resistance protein/dioxygenase [Modestobacter italicus]|uniref:Glyoxalase/bleomycin resistance protein/dioxygenase n=1 Tax=Modestobacter italicus (strain DSM 44449 / CECT 9708 / BC 501) TaxID=2732864 RepID=I4F0X8_MODI5|nr:VOC family protein [Modestobacter marinus]CCH89291.1 Glyoxalase/bleomycin resistance protein/dioxygenase [Modestobacter marinus]